MSRKKILIAGFGDTGVLSAIHLSKTFEICAVSTKPMLLSGQELGVRIIDPKRWQEDYQIEFSRYKHLDGVNIIHGEVTHIDHRENIAHIKQADGELIEYHYHVLLVASGVSNGFWRNGKVENKKLIQVSLAKHCQKLSSVNSLCVVGGGPTAVSAAYNVKKQFPEKQVSLYFPQETVLTAYPLKTRQTITHMLKAMGVELYAGYRAHCPENKSLSENTLIEWQTGQDAVQAEMCLWAVGQLKPNSQFLPSDMLDENGFVNVDAFLRVQGYENIFAVGDIANSDANRSSARNEGFKIVARNIEQYLQGTPDKMKPFKAPKYRWGSIIGVQLDEGLRVFTPGGSNVRVSLWWVKKLLFPFFVRKMIYKGVRSV